MKTTSSTFAKYGLGAAVGLVVMTWAFESLHWHNYLRANPQTGPISGDGVWLYYPLFMFGAVLAFTALLGGIQRAIHGESGG
jgi:hypothetical protein